MVFDSTKTWNGGIDGGATGFIKIATVALVHGVGKVTWDISPEFKTCQNQGNSPWPKLIFIKSAVKLTVELKQLDQTVAFPDVSNPETEVEIQAPGFYYKAKSKIKFSGGFDDDAQNFANANLEIENTDVAEIDNDDPTP